MNSDGERLSLSEVARIERERRQKENPWTEADEARLTEKRRLERERHEAWERSHPAKAEEDDEEEQDEDEGTDN